jgi:hypothetical protein
MYLRCLTCIHVLKYSYIVFEEECGGGEAQVNGRSNKADGSDNAKELCQAWKRDGGFIGATDEVPIRTYAGLSALTQERIRRYVVLCCCL